MHALYRSANRHAVLRDSDGNLGRCLNSERTAFRVTVVHTSTEGTIAALRTAAGLAAGLGAELAFLWTEEIPVQFPLHDLPVSVELLERQVQKIVYLSGIRESQVLTQLLLCRNKYTSISHVLPAHSLVVVGKSPGWWRQGRKIEKVLRASGHQVVPVIAPRTTLFTGHWNWQVFLIRSFMNLAARKVGA
jgi:hypothetical protein